MKKIFSFIFIALMCISLSSCAVYTLDDDYIYSCYRVIDNTNTCRYITNVYNKHGYRCDDYHYSKPSPRPVVHHHINHPKPTPHPHSHRPHNHNHNHKHNRR